MAAPAAGSEPKEGLAPFNRVAIVEGPAGLLRVVSDDPASRAYRVARMVSAVAKLPSGLA